MEIGEGIYSLFVAKRVTTVVAAVHPMSVVHAKVQAFKCSMATTMLVDAEFELRNNRLAIQGKVQFGHSFEAYCLAKRLAE
jgi:hypothetical protein